VNPIQYYYYYLFIYFSPFLSYNESIPFTMLERVLQKLRVDEYKRRMFRDFFFYVLFIVIFLTVIFLGRDIRRVYYMESALRDKFIEEEFLQSDSYIYKSFDDIGELSEFWQFMRGPFVGALASVNAFEQGYILSFNRIIGAPRIRQVRVRDKCSLSAPLASFFEHCYPNYEYELRSTEPFGPDLDQYLAQLDRINGNSTVASNAATTTTTTTTSTAPPLLSRAARVDVPRERGAARVRLALVVRRRRLRGRLCRTTAMCRAPPSPSSRRATGSTRRRAP
jgi:hypothetical protein